MSLSLEFGVARRRSVSSATCINKEGYGTFNGKQIRFVQEGRPSSWSPPSPAPDLISPRSFTWNEGDHQVSHPSSGADHVESRAAQSAVAELDALRKEYGLDKVAHMAAKLGFVIVDTNLPRILFVTPLAEIQPGVKELKEKLKAEQETSKREGKEAEALKFGAGLPYPIASAAILNEEGYGIFDGMKSQLVPRERPPSGTASSPVPDLTSSRTLTWNGVDPRVSHPSSYEDYQLSHAAGWCTLSSNWAAAQLEELREKYGTDKVLRTADEIGFRIVDTNVPQILFVCQPSEVTTHMTELKEHLKAEKEANEAAEKEAEEKKRREMRYNELNAIYDKMDRATQSAADQVAQLARSRGAVAIADRSIQKIVENLRPAKL